MPTRLLGQCGVRARVGLGVRLELGLGQTFRKWFWLDLTLHKTSTLNLPRTHNI